MRRGWKRALLALVGSLVMMSATARPLLSLRLSASETESSQRWQDMYRSLAACPGCCDEIWFSTGIGMPTLDWHRAQAERIAVAMRDAKKAGIVPSLQFQATLGHGDAFADPKLFGAKTWAGWTDWRGLETRFCNCPRQPAFLAYLREVSKIYAPLGFGGLWIDDDLRIGHHKPADSYGCHVGCWCSTCIAAYNAENGSDWTRAALASAVETNAVLAARWRAFSVAAICGVARAIAEPFRELSPTTQLAFQQTYGEESVDQASAVLKTLHEIGGKSVGYRPGGGYYYDDDPSWQIHKSIAAGWFRGRIGDPDYVSVWTPEIESCPRTYYSRSPQGILVEGFSALMYGMNAMSFYVAQGVKESPELYGRTFWPVLAAAAPALKGYAEAIKDCRPVGYSMPGDPFRNVKPGDPQIGIRRAAIPIISGIGESCGLLTENEVACDVNKMTSADIQNLRDELDRRAGGLPAVACSPFLGLMQIHCDRSGLLRTVALLNMRISSQGPIRLRLRKLPEGVSSVVWQELCRPPVTLPLERTDDGAFVTVPSVGAWNAGYLMPAVAAEGEKTVVLPETHLRFVSYELLDQTDGHNELVYPSEWVAGPNEGKKILRTNVLAYEEVLTGKGVVYLRLAPLPHARANPEAEDFTVDAHDRCLTIHATGYPCVELPYAEGRIGRIKALQDYQRSVRPFVAGRDGLFLSNTWGDRNRDTRINEEFLLEEVRAAAELGVEVLQVDDGWQSGRSKNSAFAGGKGVWNGYWAASPDFWTPDPKRFPHGLSFVTKQAAEKGIRFGLWFGPDSSNEAANWERDADWLLKLHRECGIDYYKLDSMKTNSKVALERQRKLFEKLLKESDGKIVVDMDVTAERRPGYFGMMQAGPLFVENRYTDCKSYWPHLTLRTLWSLAEVIDPVRLRMEVLNPLRNTDKYGDDPLAPAAYPAETLFAMVMPASPLGWFEVQNMKPETVAAWKPLVSTWKREREAMAGCNAIPVGACPDGVSWTGFVFVPRQEGAPGYGLFFRELSEEATFAFDLGKFFPPDTKVEVLSPRGTADLRQVGCSDKRDFVWVKLRTP